MEQFHGRTPQNVKICQRHFQSSDFETYVEVIQRKGYKALKQAYLCLKKESVPKLDGTVIMIKWTHILYTILLSIEL